MAEQAVAQPVETFNDPGIDARLRVQQYIGELPLPDVFKSPAEVQDIGAYRDPDGSIVAEAKEISMGALEKARFFVKEKAEHVQQGWDSLQTKVGGTKIGKIGVQALAGAAVLTAGTPVAQAAVEKTPVLEQVDRTPEAKAALHGTIPNVPSFESGEDQGTGGYPYANAPLDSVDELKYLRQECAAYVRWRVIQSGVDPRRAVITQDLDYYRAQGEVVDSNPAVGAIAILQGNSGHAMVVEAFDDATGDLWVSERNWRKNDYSVRKLNRNDNSEWGGARLQYVHFEIPKDPSSTPELEGLPKDFQNEIAPAEKFMGAEYDKRNKNAITMRHPLKPGAFIQSESGQYRLVVDKTSAKLWDIEGSQKVKWMQTISMNGRRTPSLRIKKSPSNGIRARSSTSKNVLSFNSLDTEIPVGNATRLVLEDDGKLYGYNGKKLVLKGANTLSAVPRAARAAARKANKTSNSSSTTKSTRK